MNTNNVEISRADEDTQTKLVRMLERNHLTIATAESLTGGLISEMITRVPGSSKVIGYSFVVYSEEAKNRILSVKKETLEKYTVYSEETAREMALGAAEKSGAQVALSVTGVAGPDGGSTECPIGTVYAGAYINGKLFSKRFSFTGDREHIRVLTAKYAMEYIYSLIIGEYE